MKYTAIDYLNWRGDIGFNICPVNPVDELLFACVGNPDYTELIPKNGERILLKTVLDKYLEIHRAQGKLGLLGSDALFPMLEAMSASERYRELTLSAFVNKIDREEIEQFSALTLHLPFNTHYISFRGTDDSLVGWKENCELAIEKSIPAQRDALTYLEKQASFFDGDIILCGHSKGGNLAVYAACMASDGIKSRIKAVYSYDGPGFMPEFLSDNGYLEMKDRITTFVPYRSIVGMLMYSAGKVDVIASEAVGAAAHDVLKWNVSCNDLVRIPELSSMSRIFDAAIDAALDNMDLEARREMVKELFTILSSTGAVNLLDFSGHSLKKTLEMAAHFRRAPELKAFLVNLSELSVKEALKQRRGME